MHRHQQEQNQIQALAVPIFGPDEQVIASLGIYLPAIRFTDKNKEKITAALIKTGKEISSTIEGGK